MHESISISFLLIYAYSPLAWFLTVACQNIKCQMCSKLNCHNRKGHEFGDLAQQLKSSYVWLRIFATMAALVPKGTQGIILGENGVNMPHDQTEISASFCESF